jgi:hypothetical protein
LSEKRKGKFGRFRELSLKWQDAKNAEYDKDFGLWIQSFTSKYTISDYEYNIFRLFEQIGLRPKDIVAQYRASGQARADLIDTLNAYIKKTVQEGKSNTAEKAWSTVASLLIHRNCLVSQSRFEIKKPTPEFLAPQYIPTQEEYEAMQRYAGSARNRFLLGYYRWGGGRLGSADDPGPMRLNYILDLDFDALAKKQIKFSHPNSCAVLIYGDFKGKEIRRSSETYVSFIAPEAMRLLTEYLEERLRDGELLTPESFLFIPDRNDDNSPYKNMEKKPCVGSRSLGRQIAVISKAAGYTVEENGATVAKYTAHSLRRLFYNSLQGLEDVDKECLHGHIKGVKARYHGSVDEIRKAVEFMRGKYEFGMRSFISANSPQDLRKQIIIETARAQNMPEAEIAGIQKALGMNCTIDQLREAIQKGLRKRGRSPVTAADGGRRPYEARLIGEPELVEHVAMGWEVVRELQNGQVLVRKPS